jgi:hypothetical protein
MRPFRLLDSTQIIPIDTPAHIHPRQAANRTQQEGDEHSETASEPPSYQAEYSHDDENAKVPHIFSFTFSLPIFYNFRKPSFYHIPSPCQSFFLPVMCHVVFIPKVKANQWMNLIEFSRSLS